MDEWADDQGNIAPETYKAGFAHSMLKYLVYAIDEKIPYAFRKCILSHKQKHQGLF